MEIEIIRSYQYILWKTFITIFILDSFKFDHFWYPES